MHTDDPIPESENIDLLAPATGFRGLPKSSLELVGRESECLKLSAGYLLFEEGAVDDALYIVATGTLQMVATPTTGCPQPVAVFHDLLLRELFNAGIASRR